MAKKKDRGLLKRGDWKNWLPREDETEEFEERRPAWASDLENGDASWAGEDGEDSESAPDVAEAPEDGGSAAFRPSAPDAGPSEEAADPDAAGNREDAEHWSRVRQAAANKTQADAEWEREAQRVESSQTRRRPLASDRAWEEEDFSHEAPHGKKKSAAPAKKKSAGSRTDEEERRGFVRTIAIVLICGVLLLTVALMVLSNFISHPLLALPRKMVTSIVTPVQGLFSGITDQVVDYLRTLKIRGNLEYGYEQLRLQVEEDANELALLAELRRENESLRDLVFEQQQETHMAMNPLGAQVIGMVGNNYFSTLTLNVGTKNGVQDYMAVVSNGGLVGVTYNTTENKCDVRCIIDSDCSVAALVESSRDQGTVKGTLGTNGEPMCRMYYLPDNSLPRPGDRVSTSGVGLEFPKGIPIGYIRESTRGMEDNKSYVVVEPVVDFQHLEYVTVYRYRPFYAEEAQERVNASSNIKVEPLVTARPVPTFSAEGVSDFLFSPGQTPAPTPDGQTAAPTAVPTSTPVPRATPDPNATKPPENLTYQTADQAGVTPTPSPRPTYTPSPSPVPTPDPGAMTVEDDE